VGAFSSNGHVSKNDDQIVELAAVIYPASEDSFCSFNPETGTTSQGETREDALANLIEATELYLEEFPLASSQRAMVTTFQVVRGG
jgi:predicted RNase H-like HicB family nuclease